MRRGGATTGASCCLLTVRLHWPHRGGKQVIGKVVHLLSPQPAENDAMKAKLRAYAVVAGEGFDCLLQLF